MTRLVSRNRFRPPTLVAASARRQWAGKLVTERKTPLGIKARAERLASTEAASGALNLTTTSIVVASVHHVSITEPLFAGRAPASGYGPREPRESNGMTDPPGLPPEASPPLELDMISSRWQLALDAAERAIGAAQGFLPSSELTRLRRDLTQERQQTAQLLSDVAQVARAPAVPWLSPVPVTAHMLGLPATARACVFDLEGVLTDTALMHAQAWGVVFDDLLLRLSEKTHWHFIPFDSDADYYSYLDGRPRLEGIHAFSVAAASGCPKEDPTTLSTPTPHMG